MFSFIRTKGFHKKVLPVVLVLGFLAAVMGCGSVGDDDTNYPGTLPTNMAGKWTSMMDDNFEITGTPGNHTIKYDDGGYGYGYEGSIEFVSNYDSKSGVIIIKYTDVANVGSPTPYHAIYYLDFKPAVSVELNNTSVSTPPYNADTATLDEAITKFTKGKMGNYVNIAYSVPYNKT